jgi:hypothetical protein
MHKLNLFILEVERQKSSVIVTVFKKVFCTQNSLGYGLVVVLIPQGLQATLHFLVRITLVSGKLLFTDQSCK